MKILQYCSVCKTQFEMEVVPTADGDDDGVVWLQCPSCKGFLPKIRSSLDLPPVDPSAAGTAEEEPSPDSAGKGEEAGPGNVDPDDVVQTSAAAVDTAADIDTAAGEPAPEEKGSDAVIGTPGQDAEAEADEPLPDLDPEKAVIYRSWSAYEVGDVIKHLAWDDYGMVVAKEQIPGNRQVVKVHFAKSGIVRLIEQDGSRP